MPPERQWNINVSAACENILKPDKHDSNHDMHNDPTHINQWCISGLNGKVTILIALSPLRTLKVDISTALNASVMTKYLAWFSLHFND